MEMNEYQNLAERTARGLDARERYLNFGFGLAGETGEAVDYLKKVLFHGHEMDKERFCKECGDILWYVSTLANTAGISLDEVAQTNLDKLQKRYPEGFSSEDSINRVE